MSVFSKITKPFKKLMDKVKSFFKKVGEFIKKHLKEILIIVAIVVCVAFVYYGFAGTGSFSFTEAIKGFCSSIWEGLSKIGKFIASNIGKIIEGITSLISGLFTGVGGAASSIGAGKTNVVTNDTQYVGGSVIGRVIDYIFENPVKSAVIAGVVGGVVEDVVNGENPFKPKPGNEDQGYIGNFINNSVNKVFSPYLLIPIAIVLFIYFAHSGERTDTLVVNQTPDRKSRAVKTKKSGTLNNATSDNEDYDTSDSSWIADQSDNDADLGVDEYDLLW